jgi:NAD(P)-dependent dehydrogenase (short-subunit alcohol dehydrogenase family)
LLHVTWTRWRFASLPSASAGMKRPPSLPTCDVRRVVDFTRERFGDADIAVSNVYPKHERGFDDATNEDFREATRTC